MRGSIVASSVVGLVLALLPGVAGAEESRDDTITAPAVRDTFPLRRTADFTEANRPASITPSATPYNRLVSATFDLDLDDLEFFGEANLAASVPDPPNSPTPTVFWVAGKFVGNSCNEFGAEDYSDTFPGIYTNVAEDLLVGWETADCATALLYSVDGILVDVLVGPLVDELPNLSVGRPELLGSKKLDLVRGVWTKLIVPVANSGPGSSGEVEVSGKGKGLKVRAGRTGFDIGPSGEGSAEIEVKLTGKAPKAKLELTASWEAIEATRKVSVAQVAPPARPVPGSYRSSNGSVRFTITGGKAKISGFNVRTRTDCGAIPTTNTYDFPKTVIPRNGIVDAVTQTDLFTTSLQLRVSGGRVTDGSFSYGGPGGCRASETFTARPGR